MNKFDEGRIEFEVKRIKVGVQICIVFDVNDFILRCLNAEDAEALGKALLEATKHE